MASISSLGISGLPLSELLANLRTAEEAPLALLENRVESYETKISGYGIIKNSLSSLQTSFKALGETSTFNAMSVSSSNTTALTASIASGNLAVAGSYSIEVGQLASTQSLVTVGQDSRTEALSASDITLKLTVGGEVKEVVVAAADTSLEGIRKAVNDAKIGVSATLLNNGNGETGAHQFVLSTNETGTAAAISQIAVTGDDAAVLQGMLGFDASVPVDPDNPASGVIAESVAAQDAKLTINGISISSGKNTVEDAIEGVTLKLAAPTTEGAPLSLRVSENNSVANTAINAFVSAYNSVYSVISQLTTYNAAEDKASVLTGDRVPRTVQTQLRSVIGSLSGEGGIQMLSQLGITTDPNTGRLEVDSTKLGTAVAESMPDIEAFFSGENGLAAKLEATVKGLLSDDGILSTATQGLEKSIKSVAKQYESTTSRIEDTMARYQAQFVQLETMMAQLNSTSSYLGTQLSMLENLASSNKKS